MEAIGVLEALSASGCQVPRKTLPVRCVLDGCQVTDGSRGSTTFGRSAFPAVYTAA